MGERREVTIISKQNVRPSPGVNQHKDGEERANSKGLPSERSGSSSTTIHLTPSDLKLISWNYIQKGILFHRPSTDPHPIQDTVSSLLTSFSAALALFFPLAGRLRDTQHADSTLTVSLDCTDQGAEFVHASALAVTVSDLLTPYRIPHIVRSLFPLDGLLNYEGCREPLLAAQVTELSDGIFVALSANHAAADGTSFWHFFNAWSEICRSGTTVGDAPVFERWFPDSCPPPLRLPFQRIQDIIRTVQLLPVEECFFHFSAESVANLKLRANAEVGTNKISSLQSVLAHVWRSVTRARGLKPEQATAYIIAVGCRSRLQKPPTYFGNSVTGVRAKALAGEVAGEGLGRAALLLNNAVASQTEVVMHEGFESWMEKPSFVYLNLLGPGDLLTGSSQRFNVYGNDFGWGRPVAVRSGRASKMDGKVTVYQGTEPGSMGLEVCLSPAALSALLEDGEFMEAVV